MNKITKSSNIKRSEIGGGGVEQLQSSSSSYVADCELWALAEIFSFDQIVHQRDAKTDLEKNMHWSFLGVF